MCKVDRQITKSGSFSAFIGWTSGILSYFFTDLTYTGTYITRGICSLRISSVLEQNVAIMVMLSHLGVLIVPLLIQVSSNQMQIGQFLGWLWFCSTTQLLLTQHCYTYKSLSDPENFHDSRAIKKMLIGKRESNRAKFAWNGNPESLFSHIKMWIGIREFFGRKIWPCTVGF